MVKYAYREEFAEHAGMREDEVYDTGVIAQEVCGANDKRGNKC